MNTSHDIIRFPVNTEKSRLGWTDDGSGRCYSFEVTISSTKPQIKRAVEDAFEVAVKDVRTMRRKGKTRRRQTKSGAQPGKTRERKIAFVTLAPGEKIAFFDGI